MCSSSHHRETSTPTQATTHPHLCTSIGSDYYTLKHEEPVELANTHRAESLASDGETTDLSGWNHGSSIFFIRLRY